MEYIDIQDHTYGRKTSLGMESNGTLRIVGELKHGSYISFDIDDLKKLRNWADTEIKHYTKEINQ